MSNRTLFLILGFVVAGFFVFLASDLQKTRDAVAHDGLKRDFVSGTDGSFGAAASYDFAFPTPTLRRDLSTDEIGRVASQTQATNSKMPGLTDVKFHLGTTYRFNVSRRWFKGGVEMWVSHLVVQFGFTDITVYLSRDYAEGSCQLQAVREHENLHVEAHRRVWQAFQPILQEALRKARDIPMDSTRGIFDSEAEGKARIEKAISEVTDPVFDAFRKADEEAQVAIDSRAEYEGVKEKCGSW